MTTYYIGAQTSDGIRYFYGIRRDDDGMLYFVKSDQLTDENDVIINNPGLTENDFTEFQYGVDFFDGRLESDHSRPHSNLHWDQYRWDNRNMFYYINDNGEFIVRLNKQYDYPPDAEVL